MAIMIPSVISPDVKSNAEKHIFKWFQKAPGTEDWIILHSLGVSNHKKVIHGEVDFFALIPEMGIFALEVKGGRVRRQNGIWSFTDKYGHTDTKERGPFDQAWEGIYSLKESISKMLDTEHRGLKDIIFGIGVMFPDVEYSSIGVDAESWQIFDSSDGENVVAFISRISEGAKNTWKRTRGKIDKRNIPNVDDIKYLADLLRGDFDLVPLLGTKMTYVDEDLCALTREQYKCLDQIEDNPRCLVRGAAGTGKTMLAIEATKNAVANGETVALFCFNRLLGEWLQNYFVQQPINLRPVYVGTLHGYMRNILVAHGKNISVSDDLDEDEKQHYYSEVLPQMAIDCLYSDTAKFDRIIVDEAQDIISESYLNFLGSCIKRGIDRGRWMMFGDLSMQAIYGKGRDEETFIAILDRYTSFARFKLSINCRNTKKICEEVRTITGIYEKSKYQKIIDGPPVQYITYSGVDDERDKLVKILMKLSENQVEKGDITILSPRRREKSVVNVLQEINVPNFSIPKIEDFTFSTIQAFKGLENKVVILVDIEHFHDKKLMYVGLSRARTGLYVLETESANKEYAELFIKRRL